jgi:hypothetical protein
VTSLWEGENDINAMEDHLSLDEIIVVLMLVEIMVFRLLLMFAIIMRDEEIRFLSRNFKKKDSSIASHFYLSCKYELLVCIGCLYFATICLLMKCSWQPTTHTNSLRL